MTNATEHRAASSSKSKTSFGMWAAVVLAWAASIAVIGLASWVQWQMAYHYGDDETSVWLIVGVVLSVPVTGSMLLTARAVLRRMPGRWTTVVMAVISLLLVLAVLRLATTLGLA